MFVRDLLETKEPVYKRLIMSQSLTGTRTAVFIKGLYTVLGAKLHIFSGPRGQAVKSAVF